MTVVTGFRQILVRNPNEIRIYDRLFKVPEPGRDGDYIQDLNPESRKIVDAQLEPALRAGGPEARSRQVYQFERHGYFVADYDELTFNRTVTLRDSWATANQPPKHPSGK